MIKTIISLSFVYLIAAQSSTCLSDVEGLAVPINAIVADLSGAVPNIAQALTDISTLLTDLHKAAGDCLPANACTTDLETILGTGESLVSAVAASNYQPIVNDVIKYLPVLNKTIQACAPATLNLTAILHPESHHARKLQSATCMSDVLAALPDIIQIMKDYSAAGLSGAVTDLQTLLTQVGAAQSDCKGGARRLLQSGNVQGDCISDILSLVSTVEQAVSDASSGNITAIITDVQEAVSIVESIVSDCSLWTEW